MVSTKHSFWLALIFTIAVFIIGLSLGFFLESNRQDRVETNILNSEINLLDEQLRDDVIKNLDIGCEEARASLFEFANNIYEDAKILEKYDAARNFGGDLKSVHRRYDLLRTLLWLEAIDLKAKCGDDFHTFVYLYDYGGEEDLDKKSRQNVYSKVLEFLKDEHGEDMLLIPIAGNLELESVDLILEKYGIEELPVVIVDEKTVLKEYVIDIEEIEKVVFEANN